MARQKINVRFDKDLIETELSILANQHCLTASQVGRAAMNIGIAALVSDSENSQSYDELYGVTNKIKLWQEPRS